MAACVREVTRVGREHALSPSVSHEQVSLGVAEMSHAAIFSPGDDTTVGSGTGGSETKHGASPTRDRAQKER